MKPALQIHPDWMNPRALDVSDTWRWFNLEHWMPLPSFAGARLHVPLCLAAESPSGYPAMLVKAAWIVAEAIWRDGVSIAHLEAGDMRWARRLGLALLGDGPFAGVEPIKAGRDESERRAHALRVMARVRDSFPVPDQALLHLALVPVLYTDIHADHIGAGQQRRTSTDKAGRGADPLTSAPSNKLLLLVRLSKRYAAASFGVDLRQPLVPEPTTHEADARSASRETPGREFVRIEPTMSDFSSTHASGVRHVD